MLLPTSKKNSKFTFKYLNFTLQRLPLMLFISALLSLITALQLHLDTTHYVTLPYVVCYLSPFATSILTLKSTLTNMIFSNFTLYEN